MSKSIKCLYCYNELPMKSTLESFCNEEHKKKYEEALSKKNYAECPVIVNMDSMTENDKMLQQKFLSKIGKRKAKEKLTISGGVL